MKFTHKVFYNVKNSDGSEDSLQVAGVIAKNGKLLVLNGGRWYQPRGSLNPDKVVDLESGMILSPLQRLEIGCSEAL